MKLKPLKKLWLLIIAGLFLVSFCSKQNGNQTVFKQNKLKDAGSTLSYEQLVAAVGKAKADILIQGAGSEFDRLVYALGNSNVITLVNQVTCAEHMVDLLNNLNAGRVVTLVNQIDDFADVARSANFVSSAAPTTLDTIGRISTLLNAIHTHTGGNCTASTAVVNAKLTTLIATIAPSAGLDTNGTVYGNTATPAQQIANIAKLAKTVAHLTNAKYTGNLIPLINGLTGAQIVGRLGRVIVAIGDGDRLVEVVETSDAPAKLIRLITEIDTNDAVAGNKLSTLISGVSDGTKLGYIITNSTSDATPFSPNPYDSNNTTGIDKLIYILNKLSWPGEVQNLANLVDQSENALHNSWTGQVNNWVWGNPTKEAPANANSTIPRLINLIQNVTEPQDLVYILQNVSNYAVLRYVITDVIQISDLTTLINQLSQKPPNPSGVYDNALATLAGIINGLAPVAASESWKLRIVVNGCRHSFNITPPCAAANQTDYLNLLRDTINNINENNAKAAQGPLPNNPDDPGQSIEKMVALIRGDGADFAIANVSNRWYPEKLIDLIYSVNNGAKLATVINAIDRPSLGNPREAAVNNLVYVVKNVTNSTKLVAVINGLTQGFAGEPNDAVMRLSYLVNEMSAYESGLVAGDPSRVAGQKLTTVLNNISNASDLSYVVDNVRTTLSPATQIGGLRGLVVVMNYVNLANIGKVATLIEVLSHECDTTIPANQPETAANCTGNWDHTPPTPNPFVYTAGSRASTTNIAKLVNLIEFVDYNPQNRTVAMQDLATVINNTTDVYKLAHLIDNTANSTNVVGLVNAVLNATNASTADLSSLLNNIVLADTPKLSTIVQNLQAATETNTTVTTPSARQSEVGILLGTYDGYPAGIPTGVSTGVGFMHMATLIRHLGGTTQALRLTHVLNGLNDNLNYNGNNISRREGLVRLLLVSQHGSAQTFTPNVYTPPTPDINFPAIGPYHLSILMNNAASANSLITLMNGVNIMDAIVTIGCVDHVGDYEAPFGTHDGDNKTINGIPTPNPNFQTPCQALPGSGW